MLGMAAGMGKRVLVLQEQPGPLILDLGTLLHRFAGVQDVRHITKSWFEEQLGEEQVSQSNQESETDQENSSVTQEAASTPISSPNGARSRRIGQARIRFFGSPDANFDLDLMDYFVETPEYFSALQGAREIFVGRKGIGKSATFTAVGDALKQDRNVLPILITPGELEFEQLADVLSRLNIQIHPNFLYPSFWRFIIYTEMVKTLVEEGDRFLETRTLSQTNRARIRGIANELEAPIAMDFSTRIVTMLSELRERSSGVSPENIQPEVEKIVGQSRLYGLEDALIQLSESHTINIAIDDIDKRWNPAYEPSVLWLRGLLNEINTVRRRFRFFF